jgi:hypothetical protein
MAAMSLKVTWQREEKSAATAPRREHGGSH